MNQCKASHCLLSPRPAPPSSPPAAGAPLPGGGQPQPRSAGQGPGASRATNQVQPAGRSRVSQVEAGS